MLALIRKSDRQLEAIVHSLDGYEPELYDVLEVEGDPTMVTWNGTALVPRPKTAEEEVAQALADDPLARALLAATPAQIDAWLAANVTSLADARKVLKLALLGLRMLRVRRTL